MPQIQITLPANNELNQSVQAGDILYYITANTIVGGFQVNANSSEMVQIGEIQSITGDGINTQVVLTCTIDATTTPPQDGDFLFFGKNRQVNEASIIGYYADLKFSNDSREKAELFSAACDITISSS